MSWAVGYDGHWDRDVGYGVPATCDHPKCNRKIDRGLSYVCGSEPYGGEHGCGLYFCGSHRAAIRKPHGSDRYVTLCPRCERYRKPYAPKPDHPEWIEHKLTDPSWQEWRDENPQEVERMRSMIAA